MHELAFSGFIGAVVSTVPIGPLNIALILLLVKKDYALWWSCVLGIVAADVAIGAGAYLLMNNVWEQVLSPQVELCWTAAAYGLSAVLLATGAGVLWRKQQKGWTQTDEFLAKQARSHGKASAWFAWSFFMTAVEPGLLPFWSGWWMAMGEHADLDLGRTFVLAGSIASGDALVFGFYRFLFHRFPNAASGNALERIIRWSLCLAMGVSALLLLKFLHIIVMQSDGIKPCLL